MSSLEHNNSPQFSPREVASVVQVVDTNLKGADVIIGSVTPNNIGGFVDEFIKHREDGREKFNNENCSAVSPVELLAEKRGRTCEPHAIQCDIQGAKDSSFIIEELEKRKGDEGLLELHQIILFFQREIKMRKILAEFHRVDISKRIGDFKKDDNFYQNEQDRFEKALLVLLKILKQFEKENLERIDLLPEEDRGLILTDLEKLRNISIQDFNILKPSFYNEICERLGRLVNFDWKMNVKNLMTAAENLWKVEIKNKDVESNKEDYLRNFLPEDKVLAEFCFSHGITRVRDQYPDLEDTLSWLINYSETAAKDFLESYQQFLDCPALSTPGQTDLMIIRAKRTLEWEE